MLRFVLRRLLWMLPTLFGISVLTFVVLDLGPLDRSEIEVARQSDAEVMEAERREAAVRELRRRYGMVDADGRSRGVFERYGQWLGSALRLDFAGEGEDRGSFGLRFRRALGVTVLIGLLAVGLATLSGCVLGVWLGTHCGGLVDRVASRLLLVGFALPEFLVASLLLLAFAGGLFESWLPSHGLRDPRSGEWSVGAQVWDLARHLILPVATLAIAPMAIVTRHVREATARASRSKFVAAMRDHGLPESEVRRTLWRHGLRPLATLVGSLLPAIVAGSVVVEQTFGLPGIGKMAFHAVLEKDVGTVMAVTLLVSLVTLLAILTSDILHRWLDPRVELR